MPYAAEITDLAAIRSVLALSPDGRVVWRERSPDLCARLAPAKDPIASAEEFNAAKAGQPPKYYHAKPRGYYIAALLGRVYLDTLAQALGADLKTLQALAKAETARKTTQDAKRALLRLVRLDQAGQPVWKRRTEENAPNTPAAKRADFNSKYAGRSIRPRSEIGGALVYKIGYFKIPQAQAIGWLKEPHDPAPSPSEEGTIPLRYVKARLDAGQSLGEIEAQVRVDFPDFDEFDGPTLQSILRSML